MGVFVIPVHGQGLLCRRQGLNKQHFVVVLTVSVVIPL